MFYHIFTLSLTFNVVFGAQILGLTIFPFPSHYRCLYPVFRELAVKKHNVTVFTFFPQNDRKLENLIEVDISRFEMTFLKIIAEFVNEDGTEEYFFQLMVSYFDRIRRITDILMNYPPLINYLSTYKFDVILIELVNNPLIYFPRYYQNVPIIGISSFSGFPSSHQAVGNPTHPIVSPNFMLRLNNNPTFWERVISCLDNALNRIFYQYYILPRADKIMKEKFGDDIQSLKEIEKNMSLILVTKNVVLNSIIPNVPRVIEMSGTHINPKKSLPTDIKEFLDKSSKGVVYFSLGSSSLTFSVARRIRQPNFIPETVKNIPYDVLWRVDTNETGPLQNNIMAKTWFPQQDILGHPNLKVFVTQAGFQSLEEAIFNAVPVVALPILGDQHQNTFKVVEKGFGKYVEIETATKEEIIEAIVEVAENPNYRFKAREMSKIIKDHPMTGLEKATWWIEYVIRHKGFYLKDHAGEIPLYQYLLLDIIGFCFVTVVILIYAYLKLIKIIRNLYILYKNKFKTD